MNSIYRLRPVCDNTLDELSNNYLWFSRPTEFNDTEDSNIFAFIKKNEAIGNAFNRLFEEHLGIANQAKLTGICCFTGVLPERTLWRKYPKGYNAVFVEFDRNILENHFIQHFGLGDCFKQVEYLDNPTLFSATNEYNILWKKNKEYELYKTMNSIMRDVRLLDQLFLKMFTRLNTKYSTQNEHRIILGNSNIPDKSPKLKGYKINIPSNALIKIHTQPKTPKEFINKIKACTNVSIVTD